MTLEIDWNDLYTINPTTGYDAENIADVFGVCIDRMQTLIEAENQHLRSGAIDLALAMLDEKQMQSVDYTRATDLMRRNLIALTRLIPERMRDLTARQHELMTALNENAKLISSIRTLSEQLLRGAAQETSAKHRLATYGENGRTTKPDFRASSNAIIVSTTM